MYRRFKPNATCSASVQQAARRLAAAFSMHGIPAAADDPDAVVRHDRTSVVFLAW